MNRESAVQGWRVRGAGAFSTASRPMLRRSRWAPSSSAWAKFPVAKRREVSPRSRSTASLDGVFHVVQLRRDREPRVFTHSECHVLRLSVEESSEPAAERMCERHPSHANGPKAPSSVGWLLSKKEEDATPPAEGRVRAR